MRFSLIAFSLLVLNALPGCTDLQIVHADDSVRRTPAIATANGPLSAAQAQAVVDAIADESGADQILRRHVAAEERISGQPLVAGNRVVLRVDGEATYAAMFEAIRAARDHINLETYIFEADNSGTQLAQLLLEKQRAGVQVNLIYDSIGSINTPHEFFAALEAAGARTLEFNPLNPAKTRRKWLINQRDHRKILVVDGSVAFTGGVNISDVYSRGSAGRKARKDPHRARPWRDTHAEIHGPVVAELQRMFLDTWNRQHGPTLPERNYFPPLQAAGNDLVRIVGSTPEVPAQEIYRSMISAVQNAQRSIHITNAYFVPDRQFVHALRAAAKRHVDVQLILPSYSDSGLVFHAGRATYTALLRAGVRIFERQDAMLHAKTAVIDGVWSSVGSANLDLRSFLHNDEVNAYVVGIDFAQHMEQLFLRDRASSREVTLEQWEQRPLWDRIRERFGRLFRYWL